MTTVQCKNLYAGFINHKLVKGKQDKYMQLKLNFICTGYINCVDLQVVLVYLLFDRR